MCHILLDINDYIDPCINTQLVYDLYLKSMEGHFPMINCDKFFFINKLPQVATLAGSVDVSPLGFYRVKTLVC
jgi:hypothetical protein